MSEAALRSAAGRLDEDALRENIRHRVEAAGTSFYWAMRLLPRDRRNGMYAIYAFCREGDDIAGGALTSRGAKGRSNTSSLLWRGGATRSRRSMRGAPAISWLVHCRGRCGV